jgi:multidrug efflux pump subunit AcrA (membrane-fusion protein)
MISQRTLEISNIRKFIAILNQMSSLLQKNNLLIGGALLLIATAVFLLVHVLNPKTPDWITAKVEKGDVSEIVSVSGTIEAKNNAALAFPSTGIVTEVFVQEGQEVAQGEVLATLASSQLVAQRNTATAELQIAQAQYEKLTAGASIEARSIANISSLNAEQSLARTISEEKEKVEIARRTLLSSGLIALADDPIDTATAPTVSGSYTCTNEGTYTIDVYRSSSYTNYAYRFSGLEKGTSIASIDQPTPLGTCGLYLQFDPSSNYTNSTWTITIPNTVSTQYVANASAYSLALEHQANAVAAAEDARALVDTQASEVHAQPRSEDVTAALATINQARARISEIDSLIDDRSIVAPFDGIVTDVSIQAGETATLTPVITVLASGSFELKTRIPEIDITKIAVDQETRTVFDAKTDEIYLGKISYISPLAVMIDGVAYFEATITLDTIPTWLRSGLNADVDIVTSKKEDVLRIPKRFLVTGADGTKSVYTPDGNKRATTTIEVVTLGNEGYAEIRGLQEGQIVIAP